MGTLRKMSHSKALNNFLKRNENNIKYTYSADGKRFTLPDCHFNIVSLKDKIKSTTNTYSARHIILEANCYYYMVITRHNTLDFCKAHDVSPKSLEQMQCGNPKSYNGSISVIDGRVFARYDRNSEIICPSGLICFNILFKLSHNCVIYILDNLRIESYDIILTNKHIPKIDLVKKATKYEHINDIDKYTPDDHCRALMNHTYENVPPTEIAEAYRFYALSFGQLISLAYSVGSVDSTPVLEFDIASRSVCAPNRYPFRRRCIFYENTAEILDYLIIMLRTNVALNNILYSKKPIPKDVQFNYWEDRAKNMNDDSLEPVKEKLDNKRPKSDPGK